jgi:hypothetical protein
MTKQARLPAFAAMTLSISLVAMPVASVRAEEATPAQAPTMPMTQGGKGGMMPGRPGGMGMMMSPEMMQQKQEMMQQKQEMMQQKQEMMQQHMVKMESHMANIEALLRELVELNKAK